MTVTELLAELNRLAPDLDSVVVIFIQHRADDSYYGLIHSELASHEVRGLLAEANSAVGSDGWYDANGAMEVKIN